MNIRSDKKQIATIPQQNVNNFMHLVKNTNEYYFIKNNSYILEGS